MLTADWDKLHDVSMIVVGILLQALPFLMIGTMISSLIGEFVSPDVMVKLFPKNSIKATLSALAIGVFLPLCDCAVVPVAAKLRKKGVPIHAIVTFIMAAPIVNPMVILSTIYAFPGTDLYIYRVIVGVMIAICTGMLLHFIYNFDENRPREVLKANKHKNFNHCDCVTDHFQGVQTVHQESDSNVHSCCETSQKTTDCDTGSKDNNIFLKINKVKLFQKEKIIHAILHAKDELFHVGKLFLLGVFITAFIQVYIPKSYITSFAGDMFSSIFIMMSVAFLMSICSTSDAFIARNFLTTVPISGIFGFIVFGPVMDLKNVILMTGYFKKKFVLNLFVASFFISFIAIALASLIWLK